MSCFRFHFSRLDEIALRDRSVSGVAVPLIARDPLLPAQYNADSVPADRPASHVLREVNGRLVLSGDDGVLLLRGGGSSRGRRGRCCGSGCRRARLHNLLPRPELLYPWTDTFCLPKLDYQVGVEILLPVH